MKNLKKIVSGLLGAAMVLVLSMSVALAATHIYHPKDLNTLPIGFDILGAKTGVANRTATATLVTAGQGLLFELCYYGTGGETSGKGAMAFDTDTAASIVDWLPSAGTTHREISPIVYDYLGTATATAGNNNIGCWQPIIPKRFYYGLVIEANDAGGTVMASYRLDSAVNP